MMQKRTQSPRLAPSRRAESGLSALLACPQVNATYHRLGRLQRPQKKTWRCRKTVSQHNEMGWGGKRP